MDWEALDAASRRCGDAFYVLDLGRFAANYRKLEGAFRNWYGPSRIAYSYKTNYLPVLCEWVDREGGLAEVVSGAEYALARSLGVRAGRIIFNGPCKSVDEFEAALLEGAQVNLDGEREVRMLERLAAQFPDACLRVGLRLGTSSGRFGFPWLDPEEWGEGAASVVGRIRNCGAELEAVHVHSSWGDRSAGAHAWRTERILGFCRRHFGKAGPVRIDVGGGFYSPMPVSVRSGFQETVSDFEEYGEQVGRLVAEQYPVGGPELVVEPGTALVSDAMWLVARVLDCKQMGGRRVAVTAGSVHSLKPTRHGRPLPVEVLGGRLGAETGAETGSRSGRPCESPEGGGTDLVGYTCMEDDCLVRGVAGPVEPGDFAVFGQVGAYTLVLKPPFIQPAPAVLVRDGDGHLNVARERQEWWEMFGVRPGVCWAGLGDRRENA